MGDKVLELLKKNESKLVREVAILAIETGRIFSEAARDYNEKMIKAKNDKVKA